MAKITTLLKASILGFAVMPLVTCVCDHTTLKKCVDTFVNAGGEVWMQQGYVAMMQIYCRSDVQPAILCILRESPDCVEDKPNFISSLTNVLKLVKTEDLQEICDVISKIPRDAMNCLNKTLNFNNKKLYQCISASMNITNSETQTGTSYLCSMSRSTQKCQQNAIESNCPNNKNVLLNLNQLMNKLSGCSDTNSSTRKTSVTTILLMTCFAILKM
ncbi:hypothetical protein CHS0354_022345 [Potamilus streckersoni]|uniref:Uncharacterized protein n=1 Tax=Potamilus streckersoni TaxID=2493646 RepID=A0AAE0T339_9BIVA|nr:hypothetical protein CHS0354_022345 [Potamilus streckersoni]